MSFANAASSMPFVKTGKIRGSRSPARSRPRWRPVCRRSRLQDCQGYESKAMLGMFAPAKTPAPIVEQLNTQIVRALNSPDVKQRLFDSGAEVIAGSPPELAAAMKSEMARPAS